jgi:endonuclease YncB( thermonuclease family)
MSLPDLSNQTSSNTPDFSFNGFNTYARLIDVYDGDTITCIFPLLSTNQYYKFNIRLYGVDTTEIKNKDLQQKYNAFLARQHVLNYLSQPYTNCSLDSDCPRQSIQQFLDEHVIIIWLKCYNYDKYGRILADAYPFNNQDHSISSSLLQNNLAYSYTGGTKLH